MKFIIQKIVFSSFFIFTCTPSFAAEKTQEAIRTNTKCSSLSCCSKTVKTLFDYRRIICGVTLFAVCWREPVTTVVVTCSVFGCFGNINEYKRKDDLNRKEK